MIILPLGQGYPNDNIIEKWRLCHGQGSVCEIGAHCELKLIATGSECFVIEQWHIGSAVVVGDGRGNQVAVTLQGKQLDVDTVAGFSLCGIEYVCAQSTHVLLFTCCGRFLIVCDTIAKGYEL
jgi:hypothetical protein